MIIRKVEDYYTQIQEKFPDLTRWEIDKILKHGMRSFYLHNWSGGDVLIKNNAFTMYSGKMFGSNLTFYHYWKLKYKIKFRILYRRNKEQFSGKYYFGLTQKEFEEYNEQFANVGRKKQKVTFRYIYAHKIKEESFLDRHRVHFFEIDWPVDEGFTLYEKNLTTRNARYIGKRCGHNEIDINYK